MTTDLSNYGILINYDYCTGCHTCEIACKKEHNLAEGQWGIKVMQDGPRKIDDERWEYTYIPLPTTLCDLCADRVEEGRLPTCVHHCQARVMYFDTFDELAKKLPEMPRSAIFAPVK